MPRFLRSRLTWALLLLTPAVVLSLRGADEPKNKDADNPALKFACRSSGCCLNQVSVSPAVSRRPRSPASLG